MDKLDKFNNTFINLFMDWKNIFYFVAGIYILSTILYVARNSRLWIAIVSWAILVLIAVLMNNIFKENKYQSD
jgi:hypothetical protein